MAHADVILNVLVENIGGSIQKVRQKAEDALYSCAQNGQFGIKLILNQLTNDSPLPQKTKQGTGKKVPLTSKQLKAKYDMLKRLLQNYQFAPDQQISAAKYAVKGI